MYFEPQIEQKKTEQTNYMIEWADFEKIDIRCGTIIAVEPFPKARKPAYQLTVDFGPLGIKKSSAQITKYYNMESLLQRQVIAVVNFPVKQIGNFFSECLVLGLYDDLNEVVLLQPERQVPDGSKMG